MVFVHNVVGLLLFSVTHSVGTNLIIIQSTELTEYWLTCDLRSMPSGELWLCVCGGGGEEEDKAVTHQ
jgi:hypothetical protein